MGGNQSVPPSSRSGCREPTNDCRYIIYENKTKEGWQHRICGEAQHSEEALEGGTRVKINKKGCIITLNSSPDFDGDEITLEANVDGETFEFSDENFSSPKAYTTEKKQQMIYNLLGGSDSDDSQGFNMKTIALGIGVLVLILYIFMKDKNNKSDDMIERLRAIQEDDMEAMYPYPDSPSQPQPLVPSSSLPVQNISPPPAPNVSPVQGAALPTQLPPPPAPNVSPVQGAALSTQLPPPSFPVASPQPSVSPSPPAALPL